MPAICRRKRPPKGSHQNGRASQTREIIGRRHVTARQPLAPKLWTPRRPTAPKNRTGQGSLESLWPRFTLPASLDLQLSGLLRNLRNLPKRTIEEYAMETTNGKLQSQAANGFGGGRTRGLYRPRARDGRHSRQPGRPGRRRPLLRSREGQGLGPFVRYSGRPSLRHRSRS